MNGTHRLIFLALSALSLSTTTQVLAQSQSARQADSSQGADESNDSERLICRGAVDTGSLVKGRRQCFTRAQWERMAGTRSKRSNEQNGNRNSSSGD